MDFLSSGKRYREKDTSHTAYLKRGTLLKLQFEGTGCYCKPRKISSGCNTLFPALSETSASSLNTGDSPLSTQELSTAVPHFPQFISRS